MITPGDYDITIQKGATFSQQFQLRDGNGNPLNMSGYAVSAQIWTIGKAQKLADFTVQWVNQAAAQFNLVLSDELTSELDADGYWDLLVSNPDGTKDYWLRGAATLDVGYSQ